MAREGLKKCSRPLSFFENKIRLMAFFHVIAELQSCGTCSYNQILNVGVCTHLFSLDDVDDGQEGGFLLSFVCNIPLEIRQSRVLLKSLKKREDNGQGSFG
jgi:hypothetical protein